MKIGTTIQELAQTLNEQQASKRDFIVDTRNLKLDGEDNQLVLDSPEGTQLLNVDDNCHRQVAQRLQIPWKYYDRMKSEQPDLLENNVNRWFDEEPENRMLRTIDGSARAFLSDRYRRLDNLDMAQAVLPVLAEQDEMTIQSCELTQSRMYIKAVFPKIEAEVTPGDVVQSGVVISNSETGQGAVKVESLVFRLVCSNGMIAPGRGTRKNHIGRNAQGEDSVYELFTDETLKADDRAFWMKIQDTVRAAAENTTRFKDITYRMAELTANPIEKAPDKTVELLAQEMTLTDGERGSVLTHLIGGGDLSQYGLMNAVTRTAEDAHTYDRATELEALGGQFLDMSDSQWRKIALN